MAFNSQNSHAAATWRLWHKTLHLVRQEFQC